MSLTKEDIQQITGALKPDFDRIDKKIDERFDKLNQDINDLAVATSKQFEQLHLDIKSINAVIGNYEVRLTRLEQRAAAD